MIRLVPFVLALAACSVPAAEPSYHLDATRYFASVDAEASQRTALMARLEAFAAASSRPPAGAAELLALLRTDDALRRELGLHALYVHLQAERDTNDHAAATADAALDAAADRQDDALRRSLALLGRPAAEKFLAADEALRPFRYAIEASLRMPVVPAADERAVAQLARPALDSLSDAYADLRRAALRAAPVAQAPVDRQAAFKAKWAPWLANEPAFAALLVPLVTLQEGTAHLQGFDSAADAAYVRTGLTTARVRGAVDAVRRSDAWTRYAALVTTAAARRLQISPDAVKPWDMDAAERRGDVRRLAIDGTRELAQRRCRGRRIGQAFGHGAQPARRAAFGQRAALQHDRRGQQRESFAHEAGGAVVGGQLRPQRVRHAVQLAAARDEGVADAWQCGVAGQQQHDASDGHIVDVRMRLTRRPVQRLALLHGQRAPAVPRLEDVLQRQHDARLGVIVRRQRAARQVHAEAHLERAGRGGTRRARAAASEAAACRVAAGAARAGPHRQFRLQTYSTSVVVPTGRPMSSVPTCTGH